MGCLASLIRPPEMYYPMSQWDLLGFEKSHISGKKYNAVLASKRDGRELRIPFGSTGYWQYEDSTGMNLYKDRNHYDIRRRYRFQQRHFRNLVPGMYSPSYFSYHYLW